MRIRSILPACGLMLAVSAPVSAQNVLGPQPEFEEPGGYVERKLTEFRARLDALKAQRDGSGDVLFDGDATGTAILRSLTETQPRDLTISVTGDDSVFDAPKADQGVSGGRVYITGARFVEVATPFRTISRDRELPLAVDPLTAAAFSLERKISPRFNASILLEKGLRRNEQCCLDFDKDNDRCRRFGSKLEIDATSVDMRLVLGRSPAKAELVLENAVTEGQANTVSPASPGPSRIIFKYDSGTRVEERECRQPTRMTARGVEREVSFRMRGVQFAAFGLPGLDVPAAGSAPPLDFFGTRVSSVKLGEAANKRLPSPVASYVDGDPTERFDGLRRFNGVVTASSIGIGPFLPRQGGDVILPPGARPGASDIVWSLNGVIEARHRLTYNMISVKTEGLVNGAMLQGQEYDVEVIIDGPVDFQGGGYTMTWGGGVIWTQGSGQIEAQGDKTIIRNRMRASNDLRPVITIDMNGPQGEIFTYDSGFIVGGRAFGLIDLRAIRGFDTSDITAPRRDAIDTFFPSSFPPTPVRISAQAQIFDDAGDRIDVLAALRSVFIGLPQLPAQLLSSSNTEFLRKPSFGGNASAVFEVTPRIGFAEIRSVLGETSGLARALTGGAASRLEARPILVTGNALRLIRDGNGFTLRVRGAADMTRYVARWIRRGFGPTETRFSRDDEGFFARLDTKERLGKVEIIDEGEIAATMLGVMATLPASIQILPFRTSAQVVDKVDPVDLGQLSAIEANCVAGLQFEAGAAGRSFDSGAAKDSCRGGRAENKAAIKQQRSEQQERNKFLRDLDRSGKALVELSQQMEVAAVISGAPSAELGQVVCEWAIIGASAPLQVAQRITQVERRDNGSSVCFNVVTGVRDGFTPGAEIEVRLKLIDAQPPGSAIESGLTSGILLNGN